MLEPIFVMILITYTYSYTCDKQAIRHIVATACRGILVWLVHIYTSLAMELLYLCITTLY